MDILRLVNPACYLGAMLHRILNVAVLLGMFSAISTSGSDLKLVQNGKSRYQIVVASDAIPSERYAAEELQRYVEKITGARIPIVADAAKASKTEILLGANARTRKLGLGKDMADLGEDGYLFRTIGDCVVILGARPRGTLNGVYSLLEEEFGVRWFTPELEVVPHTNALYLRHADEIKVPELENREVFWTEMMRDGDFAARHRLNGHNSKLTEKHGGRFAVYYPFVHSFDMLVPQDLYKDHPEYFPVINGKRASGYVQRCLSNPEVVKMSIARVREWIKEHPEASIFSVSQNDTFNYCQCETCKALDDAEGTPTASLIKFVNTIAQDIEKDYPKVRIDTLAYQYTRKPPKTLRPRQNVIIRLCSIECCFAHSLENCASDANKRFRGDIIAWMPVAPLLYVWDYTPNFANYQQPFPNFDALQPNVKFFTRHNVKGLFEQGNYSSGGFGELGPVRAYVLAKLLWNPDTDVQRHIQEFCRAYYGNAAPGMRQFLDLMHAQVRGKDVHAHIFDSPKAAYLNDAFVGEADKLLAKTEAAAGAGAEQFRVRVARLPIWYLQLVRDLVKGEERTALLKEFMTVAEKAGISNISEGQALKDWAEKMSK